MAASSSSPKNRRASTCARATSFVFNATNLTRELRGKWTQLFANYRARIHITYLEVPWPQLLAQNKQRAHAVPEDVIRHLLGKLEIPGYDEAHEWHM